MNWFLNSVNGGWPAVRLPRLPRSRASAWILSIWLAGTIAGRGAENATPAQMFASSLSRVAAILEPPTNPAPRTFSTTIRVVKAGGFSKELAGQAINLAFQYPDHLRVAVEWKGEHFIACRDGQQLWVHMPDKKFGLIGSPDAPLFAAAPDLKDHSKLGPLQLPVPPEQFQLLPLLSDVQLLAGESVEGVPCQVIKATVKPEAVSSLHLPKGSLQLWIRPADNLPLRLAYHDPKGSDWEIELLNPEFSEADTGTRWKVTPAPGEKFETVARSHLTRFLSVSLGLAGEKVAPLGPATGERKVVGREGAGRLEEIDGTRVLILKGTPEEMGRQHGVLLKKEVRSLVDHMLYGVGVGTSFEKGEWVFGQIEGAQRRLARFMDERYYREMDALADAAGLPRPEVRLANFFPEMFHCSGFAVFGKATTDGRLYHGRILDYLRGLGLEQAAVVVVNQPDRGNAWVNIGYAGFIGSVTAMNEKHVAIGEMGGAGQGRWDGKPMAELVREVMENANTLEQAVEIMRRGPRTCEYYYVISDAKTKRAVGIAATPDKFETIWPGQSHKLLPHAVPDAVLLSANERYEELARRVQAQYGHLDSTSAWNLMRRPVCMTSNIHCALFAPDTLDFWVANADSETVAAHARLTHYNLAELLKPEKTP